MYLTSVSSSTDNHPTGIGQVVPGDLVLCKEDSAWNDGHNIETKDDCNDEYNSNAPSEISEASLPDEKVQVVKVICMFLNVGACYYRDFAVN